MEFRNLTAKEVFFIFNEEHRLCSPLDPEADPSFDLRPTSTIAEWTDARDLLSGDRLAKVFNEQFQVDILQETWRQVLMPRNKALNDVCELIAQHAKIEVVKPIQIFGRTCLSFALFKSIKKELTLRGLDTNSLSPSSDLEPFLKNHFAQFLGYINKNFTGVIPEIKLAKTTSRKIAEFTGTISFVLFICGIFWHRLLLVTLFLIVFTIIFWFIGEWQFRKRKAMLTIPGILTFRDLVEKIIEKSTCLSLCSASLLDVLSHAVGILRRPRK